MGRPDLSAFGPVFDDLGRGLRAAALTRDDYWVRLISLPESFFSREPKNGLECAIGFCHPAVFGEFARIDLNIGDGSIDAPLEQELVLVLERHALPFLEGFGKVTCRNVEKKGVIFSSDFWEKKDSHFDAPIECLSDPSGDVQSPPRKNDAPEAYSPIPEISGDAPKKGWTAETAGVPVTDSVEMTGVGVVEVGLVRDIGP